MLFQVSYASWYNSPSLSAVVCVLLFLIEALCNNILAKVSDKTPLNNVNELSTRTWTATSRWRELMQQSKNDSNIKSFLNSEIIVEAPRIAVINSQPFHLEVLAGLIDATVFFRNSTTFYMEPSVYPARNNDFGFLPWIQDVKCSMRQIPFRNLKFSQTPTQRGSFVELVSATSADDPSKERHGAGRKLRKYGQIKTGRSGHRQTMPEEVKTLPGAITMPLRQIGDHDGLEHGVHNLMTGALPPSHFKRVITSAINQNHERSLYYETKNFTLAHGENKPRGNLGAVSGQAIDLKIHQPEGSLKGSLHTSPSDPGYVSTGRLEGRGSGGKYSLSACPRNSVLGKPPFDLMFFITPEKNTSLVRALVEWGAPNLVIMMIHNGDTSALETLINMHQNMRLVTLAPHISRFVENRLRGMKADSLLPVDWILAVRPLHRPRWVCPLDKKYISMDVVTAGNSSVNLNKVSVAKDRSSSVKALSLKHKSIETNKEGEPEQGIHVRQDGHTVMVGRVIHRPAENENPVSEDGVTITDMNDPWYWLRQPKIKELHSILQESQAPCLSGFSIQGNFESERRNYSAVWEGMLKALSGELGDTIRKDGRLVVNVVGSGPLRSLRVPQALKGAVVAHSHLHFHDYYNAIHHTLALVPTLATQAYYDRKFSSTIITSLVTSTPIIADDRILMAYRFLDPSCVFKVNNGEEEVEAMHQQKFTNMKCSTLGRVPTIPLLTPVDRPSLSRSHYTKENVLLISRKELVLTRVTVPVSATTRQDSDNDAPPLKWFERPCKWETISTLEELEGALQPGGDKHIAVDFFAGWCSSCKGAFPALCKIPNDKELASRFRFIKANVEDKGIYTFVKKLSAAGIPFLAVYNPEGKMVMSMSASFKKIAQVKSNLGVVAKHPDCKRFTLNPQGDAEAAE
ncbi:hypothetical protein CEUSTIGMA_g7945.t1 [Chlamydomonas eustigma]|uniref:Thioredoxin domain-containing protein n=1 Tax=Chlamydomonas eustigma TaxID=1157962 RepID=A0A250XBP8_9CHLO|nr:hypothetical protein CEUSTIGMA_g7945.t1 [Chlamydomonas eustigma]|eukprot:GAX80507.1 hypothetical protein CEUSTIGMA_g7945.t1 [Chlamydomonas eustigma]